MRDPESWYTSASNTIFQIFDHMPPGMEPWFESMRQLLGERFSNKLDDPMAMMQAFEDHNESDLA